MKDTRNWLTVFYQFVFNASNTFVTLE